MRVSVVPWLAANSVREIGIRSTNGKIKNNIELPIEWGRVVFSSPRVVKSWREFTASEEVFLCEVNLEDSI
jgi:hypothetical protein